MSLRSELKFTNTHSFRLFTAGVEALQAYEREAHSEILSQAAASLEECVRIYPNDMLPVFYLGVVKTLQGYSGLDQARALFQKILDQGIAELEPAAKFHLAWAHLEQYTPEGFDIAEHLLNEVLRATEGQKPTTESTNLRLQAEAMLAFIYVRETLWSHRKEGAALESEVAKAERRLRQFRTEADKASLAEAAKNDLLAEWNNTRGLLCEFEAWAAPEAAVRPRFARDALHAYDEALHYKANWLPAIQNKVRVHMELVGDAEAAKILLLKSLEIDPNAEYSHYLLGKIFEPNNTSKAMEHYGRAPSIPEAKEALKRLASGSTPASGVERKV